MKIRTRYAPSPTGRMHVGNLRSALYEFLIAKHAGGDFMLRIEDTDQERFVEGATEIIYRTLAKTGLVHDEGPDKDGGYGPYVQSERMKTDSASSLQVLKDVLPMLEAQEDYSNDGLYQMLLQYVEEKGVKNGYVMWPIRTAVSGKQMTPAGATEIMELLGKEETLKRIRKGIEKLENA